MPRGMRVFTHVLVLGLMLTVATSPGD